MIRLVFDDISYQDSEKRETYGLRITLIVYICRDIILYLGIPQDMSKRMYCTGKCNSAFGCKYITTMYINHTKSKVGPKLLLSCLLALKQACMKHLIHIQCSLYSFFMQTPIRCPSACRSSEKFAWR